MACKSEHIGVDPSAKYSIVRESNYFDRMYVELHRHGLQSNVIISARYNNNLSKPAVYSALRTVIEDHPDLAVVGVIVPNKRSGRHRLHRALLHNINLELCTEFIDTEEDGVGAALLEKLHNEWSWTTVEPDKPWWKLVIVNGRDALFVFHHMVCDGRFGFIFHQAFLAALNSTPASPPLPGDSSTSVLAPVIEIDPETVQTAPELRDVLGAKPSILGAILETLFWYFVRFLFGRKLFFNDVPPLRPSPKSALAVADPSQRTIMRVKSYRIPASNVSAILTACRSHDTTFTPLLMAIIGIVLATEHYPEAKVGFMRCAVDIRPLLTSSSLADKSVPLPLNSTSIVTQVRLLGKFRRTVTPAIAGQQDTSGIKGTVDVQAAWKLVQDAGRDMRIQLQGRVPEVLRTLLQGYLLGPELEDTMQTAFPSLALYLSNSFLLSNLGSFSSNPKQRGEAWNIEDVQFSAAPANDLAGYRGIIFNVAGLKGGDTVINATFEDGVIDPLMVEEVLGSAMAKINSMVGQSLSQ